MTGSLAPTHGPDRPPRGTVQVAQLRLPCHTAHLGIGRVPASARPGHGVALFLPGIASLLAASCLRAMPLTKLYDVLVGELPGHGISDPVADVSPDGFAREYAALLDRYVPAPARICLIGESFGGLVACALAQLRPDRVAHIVLLETPFWLTRPPLAALLRAHWRQQRAPNLRTILRAVFGFDPQDDSPPRLTDWHALLDDLPADCTVLAGSPSFLPQPAVIERPPSQQTDGDLDALRAIERVTVLPRIASAGHCLLLDDPQACVAALAARLSA